MWYVCRLESISIFALMKCILMSVISSLHSYQFSVFEDMKTCGVDSPMDIFGSITLIEYKLLTKNE